MDTAIEHPPPNHLKTAATAVQLDPDSPPPAHDAATVPDASNAKAVRLIWCDTAGIRRCRSDQPSCTTPLSLRHLSKPPPLLLASTKPLHVTLIAPQHSNRQMASSAPQTLMRMGAGRRRLEQDWLLLASVSSG